MKFIYTTNEEIKDKLITNDYTLIQTLKGNKNTYVFANNGVLIFNEDDKKEMFFRDELYL